MPEVKSVAEAAELIRSKLNPDTALSPEQRHQLAFAIQVNAELGRDGSFQNIAEVMAVLDGEGIVGRAFAEYPKMMLRDGGEPYRNSAGDPIIVQTAEEEAAFMDGLTKPEPQPERQVEGRDYSDPPGTKSEDRPAQGQN